MVGGDEPGPLGDCDESSEVVKEIDKEEDKDDFKQALVEGAADVELEGGGGERLKAPDSGGPMHETECPGDASDGEDADKDGAANFFHFESDHENKAEECERWCGVADVAQADEGRRVANHQSCVAKANECDKKADAAGDGGVKLMRDGAKDHPANAGGGKGEEDDPGKKDSAEGRLPGDVHLEADGIGKVGVESHAGADV